MSRLVAPTLVMPSLGSSCCSSPPGSARATGGSTSPQWLPSTSRSVPAVAMQWTTAPYATQQGEVFGGCGMQQVGCSSSSSFCPPTQPSRCPPSLGRSAEDTRLPMSCQRLLPASSCATGVPMPPMPCTGSLCSSHLTPGTGHGTGAGPPRPDSRSPATSSPSPRHRGNHGFVVDQRIPPEVATGSPSDRSPGRSAWKAPDGPCWCSPPSAHAGPLYCAKGGPANSAFGPGLGPALTSDGSPLEWWQDAIIMGRLGAVALRFFAANALKAPWKAWQLYVNFCRDKTLNLVRCQTRLVLRSWRRRTLTWGRRFRNKMPLIRILDQLPLLVIRPAWQRFRKAVFVQRDVERRVRLLRLVKLKTLNMLALAFNYKRLLRWGLTGFWQAGDVYAEAGHHYVESSSMGWGAIGSRSHVHQVLRRVWRRWWFSTQMWLDSDAFLQRQTEAWLAGECDTPRAIITSSGPVQESSASILASWLGLDTRLAPATEASVHPGLLLAPPLSGSMTGSVRFKLGSSNLSRASGANEAQADWSIHLQPGQAEAARRQAKPVLRVHAQGRHAQRPSAQGKHEAEDGQEYERYHRSIDGHHDSDRREEIDRTSDQEVSFVDPQGQSEEEGGTKPLPTFMDDKSSYRALRFRIVQHTVRPITTGSERALNSRSW